MSNRTVTQETINAPGGRPQRRSILAEFLGWKHADKVRGMLIALIVILIFNIFVPFSWTRRSLQARRTAAQTDLKSFESALGNFQMDTGRFPSSSEGLIALLDEPPGINGWKGPYVKGVFGDPWGSPYAYSSPGTHSQTKFDLSSAGPDKKFETADDLVNWDPDGR